MNRTLTNVLFGGISAPAQSDYKIEGTITKTTVEETVESLANADSVILVRTTLPALPNPPFQFKHSSLLNMFLRIVGCRVRNGGCQGAIRHFRRCEILAVQRGQCAVRHTPRCWEVREND